MYIGDDFLLEEFDDFFDAETKKRQYKKWTFKQVRAIIPQLANLRINSRDFREAREAFSLWLKQTRHGSIIPKGKGKRVPQFYLVPPVKQDKGATSFRQVANENTEQDD